MTNNKQIQCIVNHLKYDTFNKNWVLKHSRCCHIQVS